jgi:hypothetical protein
LAFRCGPASHGRGHAITTRCVEQRSHAAIDLATDLVGDRRAI